MSNPLKIFKLLLLALTLFQLAAFAYRTIPALQQSEDLVFADTVSPVGGDFINMLVAARLTVEGRTDEIYTPDQFMTAEHTIIPHDIGLRLWAYPPHSLLLVWPLAFLTFWQALTAWSVAGLLVLALGARRIGLDWIETSIVVLSPAAVSCVWYGQTGNMAAGLLLLALSARKQGDAPSILAAAILTIKPQFGLLLPVVWFIRKQFGLMALVSLASLALLLLTYAIFGSRVWVDYVFDTLSTLRDLEQHGTGPFLQMIPSMFIAVRILTDDAQLASIVHLWLAGSVVAFVIWRLTKVRAEAQRNAIILAGTALTTPYLHVYDLAPLVCAALLVARQWRDAPSTTQLVLYFPLLVVFFMPNITMAANAAGVPISPLVLLVLLLLASFVPQSRTANAAGMASVS